MLAMSLLRRGFELPLARRLLDDGFICPLDCKLQSLEMVLFHFLDGCAVQNDFVALDPSDTRAMHGSEPLGKFPCMNEGPHPYIRGLPRQPEGHCIKSGTRTSVVARLTDFLGNHTKQSDWLILL